MALASFRGVFIAGCRDAIKKAEIVELKNSTNFCVPTKLGKGSESKVLVEVGNLVKAGSVLASPSDKTSAFIYSPVSGSVVSIADGINAFGDRCKIIEIEPAVVDIKLLFKPLTDFSSPNLFGRLIESGSCDTWQDRFPSYVKYSRENSKNIKTLIVKLYDSDGFIYSNATIAKQFAKEVALGAALFYKVSGAIKLTFVCFDEFEEISKKIKTHLAGQGIAENNISFVKAQKNYPSDYDNLLAKFATGKTIKISSRVEDEGVAIENAQTCLNFYNAVYLNEPTTKAVYTISGTNVAKPAICVVKNGNSAQDLIKAFKIAENFKLESFVVGGAMCGIAQSELTVGLPLSATSLHSFKNVDNNEIDCINCGRCNKVCPTRLAPVLLDQYALLKDFGRAKRYGAEACINCGACSYVCPAKRFLAQRISDAKTAISEGRTM